MRTPALLAVTLLAAVGLSGCDLSKLKDPAAAPKGQTEAAAAPACPANTKMVCQPLTRPSTLAQPTMSPERAKAAGAQHGAYVRKTAWSRAGQASAWSGGARHAVQTRRAATVRKVITERRVVVIHRYVDETRPAVVEHHDYAGGYTGQTVSPPPRDYVRPAPDRYADAYVRREDSEQGRYRYDRRETESETYRAERREGYDARDVGGDYRYERHEVRGAGGAYAGGDFAAGCGCRTEAAGRDRQGFLTWPGKR